MSVRVPAHRAEEARAVMLQLFPDGFEEVDLEDGGLELAAYAGAGGEERLWQAFGPGEVADVEPGWNEAWKGFHRPVRVGPLWVGPPWSTPDPDAVPIVIDPGQAFGTGSHATTRLCLELLLTREPSSLADLGCGSGVLAIAAAKLGFAPVIAVDHEDAAVEAARANAAANEVEVAVERRDILHDPLPEADLALANIALEPVEKLAARVASDVLIASGYLVSERPAHPGWCHRDRREAYGWAADLFERGPREPRPGLGLR
jgi:ribosomal protein L11 methyltransferase